MIDKKNKIKNKKDVGKKKPSGNHAANVFTKKKKDLKHGERNSRSI